MPNPAWKARYECYKLRAGIRHPVAAAEPVATVEHPTDTLISLPRPARLGSRPPRRGAGRRQPRPAGRDPGRRVLRVPYGLGFDAGAAEATSSSGSSSRRGRPVQRALPAGTTIDFLNTIEESGFKIDNLNAVSSCGCGLLPGRRRGSCPRARTWAAAVPVAATDPSQPVRARMCLALSATPGLEFVLGVS